MVYFNWRFDVVCAVVLPPLNFIQSWNIECRVINILFLLAVNFIWNSKYCLVASQYFFSQTARVLPASAGFTIFFIRGGRESSHLFRSPRIVLNPCSSSLRKCNACTVRFFKNILLLSRPITYFQSCWEGWMLVHDFEPWRRHQYRLVVLVWVERHSRSIESCSQ